MASLQFPLRFHPAFRLPALVFGVTERRAVLRIDDDVLHVQFGLWSVTTNVSNIAAVSLTGGFAWPKVIGPPHLSFADRGLTFATNPDRAVCMRFRRPVRGLDPTGVLRHPALTVTVAEAHRLMELLDRPSQDVARVHSDPETVTAEDLIEATADELSSLTASELRARARRRGIRGVSRRRKAELVELLLPDGGNPPPGGR